MCFFAHGLASLVAPGSGVPLAPELGKPVSPPHQRLLRRWPVEGSPQVQRQIAFCRVGFRFGTGYALDLIRLRRSCRITTGTLTYDSITPLAARQVSQ